MKAPSQEFVRRAVEEKIAFVKRCGLKLIECEPGRVRCQMPTAGNENHIGSMYAGALFTLAEIPGGALWLSSFNISESYPLLKSFYIEYLKPAKGVISFELALSPERIQKLALQCNEQGKVDFELCGELKDEQNSTVAVTKGLYQLRKMGS